MTPAPRISAPTNVVVSLDGVRLADRREPALRARAELVRDRRGRVPTLAIIAFADRFGPPPHVARKVRACAAVGVDVVQLVLRTGTTPAEARRAMQRLADDPRKPVDAIFLQFPYPDDTFAEVMEPGIPEALDVDVMSPGRVRQYLDDAESLPPVTVSAALELVRAHDIDIVGRTGVVVAHRSPFSKMFRLAFARRGAAMLALVPPDLPDLAERMRRASLVIVAAGVPGLVRSVDIAPGAVAIDVGYFNPRGRGDIDTSGGVGHLAAIAAVPGSIGPMTVSCLIERTILLAEAQG
ncbi:MAG: tetrahydrofolate dehydrogenase/cyclohydrolase catalytic domain-containing protein [Gemmatimonadaceae bacterium]